MKIFKNFYGEKDASPDVCIVSVKLRKWGKILFIAHLVMALLQLIATIGFGVLTLEFANELERTYDSWWAGLDARRMREAVYIMFAQSIRSTVWWAIRAVLIKLFAEAFAIIVQSFYVKEPSKNEIE